MKRAGLLVAVVMMVSQSAAAQDSTSTRNLCLKPDRTPKCRAILLTTAGMHVMAGGAEAHGSPLRGIVDWGLLVNLGPRSSIGASWMLSLDRDGFTTGPTVRYRRWLSDSTSVDVGIGLAAEGSEATHAPVFGLVKWNVSRNVGIALRPELRKTTDYDGLNVPPYGCTPVSRKAFALSAGTEFSGGPGLALSAVAAAAHIALYSSISDW